jgi:formylglycine-generating enzyme required for sulfatase activity
MDLTTASLQPKTIAQTDEEIQASLACELLRLELDHWRETGSLIPPHLLAFIHHRRDALRPLAKDEAELLFHSALAAGWGGTEWVEPAWLAGAPVDAISLAALQQNNFRIRAAAVAALGQLACLRAQDGPFVISIIETLADDYPQVRRAAIRALERLQPEGQWRKHLVYECYVPAGQFVLGDDGVDLRGKKVPTHDVLVDAFYIGKYPVTNADFKRYVEDVSLEFELPVGKSQHPVVDVSWFQACDYAAWAGTRLLTEAEWEMAASWTERQADQEAHLSSQAKRQRGKGFWPRFVERLVNGRRSDREREAQADHLLERRKRVYPWGHESDPRQGNTAEARLDDTTPVGFFSPGGDSPCGCADMVGNVWEWTSTLYRDYPYRADDGREELSLSGYRVVRGGSFLSHQEVARAAGRFGLDPYFSNLTRGFRVGLSASRLATPLATN